MAKKQEAPCMFCGGLPCECDGGKTKKRSKKSATKVSFPAPQPTNESYPTSSSVESDKSTEDVFGEIPTRGKPKFNVKSHSAPDRNLSLESVLRSLYDILHPRDQKMIDKYLHRPYPRELDKRVAEWKARHGSE